MANQVEKWLFDSVGPGNGTIAEIPETQGNRPFGKGRITQTLTMFVSTLTD